MIDFLEIRSCFASVEGKKGNRYCRKCQKINQVCYILTPFIVDVWEVTVKYCVLSKCNKYDKLLKNEDRIGREKYDTKNERK